MDLLRLENASYKYLLDREAKYSKLIQKQLLNALTSIYGEMKKIYDKYAIAGKLTRAEMTKYNKYSTMEKQIIDKLEPVLKQNIETIKHLLPEQFQESFFQYAWAIDQATGLRLSWGMVNTKQLLGAFDITNPKNIELVEALHNYGPTAKKRIRAALLNGLSLGKSYDKMAKDLKLTMSKIYSSAITIIRTEGQTAINAGQALAYTRAIENGIDGNEVWSATHDMKTRPDHGRADGTTRDKDGFFYVGGESARYPGDPRLSAGMRINCRCTLRMEIDGYEPQLMRTREEGILPYQSYVPYAEQYHPEWLDKTVSNQTKVDKIVKGNSIVPKGFGLIKEINSTNLSPEVFLKKEYPNDFKLQTRYLSEYEKIQKYMGNAHPISYVPADTKLWGNIAKQNGDLWNQYQSKTSRGDLSIKSREKWEQTIAYGSSKKGSITNMPIEERPKYGIVKSGDFNSTIASDYGEVVIKYKKSVYDRSTFTLENSSMSQGAFTFDSLQKAFGKDHDILAKYSDIESGRRYLEMQIWGKVNMRTDVDEVLISTGVSKEISDSIIKNVIKLNKDIKIGYY